jgi:dihydroorotase-like cyclic amidohydrolase
MGQTVKDKIIEQLDKLGTPQQRQVLEYARGLGTPAGVSGDELLRFVGAIDPGDLETISRAILEGCEHVDLNAW